uniref:rhodanese-like domain-containing protein n=1 Tax=uncultured Cetobacterium sp. TaxID=527638 RepID=UPI00260FC56E
MKKILFLLIILSTILLGKDIKTNELLKNLNNPEWIIIDTRDSNEYNGWNLSNLKINGHIKGATDLSANWLKTKYLSSNN